MNQIHKSKIEKMLAEEFCCTPAQLNGNGVLYTVKSHTEKPFLKILAYRNCVTVCTSEDIAGDIRRLLRNKNRDEIFELPFVYGQTIHYIPDHVPTGGNSIPSDFHCEILFGNDIRSLNGLTGFENSLAFDGDGGTAAQAAYIARDGGKIIGAAGAAKTLADGVWEVGGDVREGYRNKGIASGLVSGLTKELQERDIVPFYSASVTNIGSQMVAARCGYIPCWVDTFGTTLDGSFAYQDIVDALSGELTHDVRANAEFAVSLADSGDLPRILQIYGRARRFMKESGNTSQWKDGFPPESLLAEDIRAGHLYVVRDVKDKTIHGVFAFIIGDDPTYARIEQGRWLSDTEYGTLHRVAGDGTVHGIFAAAVAFCEEKVSHLRIDTHEDNHVMQHLIVKSGFQKCGIIHVEDGSPRIAYEKGAEGEKDQGEGAFAVCV